MNTICKPSRVIIYENADKLTLSQIKSKLGCDYVINGGLFNMSTFKPVCHLKIDGNVKSNADWTRLGLGWNGLTFGMSANMSEWDNYITCVEMIMDGKATTLNYPTDMGGSRARTAFGVFDDGRVWMFAQQSPTLTIEQVQSVAAGTGVKYAICLDGGGSTQAILDGCTLQSSRIVENVICVWKASTSKTIYRVQIGAYSQKENAERMAMQLRAQGYSTIIKEDVITA